MVSAADLYLPIDLPLPPKRQKAKRMNDVDSYRNGQMDLFQTFLCNTDAERDRMSNTIDIWDCIPRYSISRQEMNKRRDEQGGLPVLTASFEFRKQSYTARIFPARIEIDDKLIDFYPSANEELIEDALRKIAARQNQGFFDKQNFRSGVAFSMYELRQELATRGHARSYQQIIQSLLILRRSTIDLRATDEKGELLVESNYLPVLAAVSQKKLVEDPSARWIVQFHPLVTQCIDHLTYRQFNYVTMMALPSQLARWIHKQLSIKFTFAGLVANPFEIRYSTIKRDSHLLNCGREIDNRRDVDEAMAELVKVKVLRDVAKQPVCAAKGKIEDVVYLLSPTPEFVREMKAANKRLQGAKDR
jgi:hypothetical protein